MSTTKLLAETFSPLRKMQGRLYSEGRRTDAETLRSLIAQTEGSVARELVKLDSRCAELRAALGNLADATARFPWPSEYDKASFLRPARAVLAKSE